LRGARREPGHGEPEDIPAAAAAAEPSTPVVPMTSPAETVSPEALLGTATPVASPAALPAATVRETRPEDQAAIRRTLALYETAYQRLDAHAAAAVWPSLDVNALSRAFEGLKMQSVAFDRCDYTIGYGTATAICSGSTRIVRRVGNPQPLTESLRWTFHLKRRAEDWTIDSVTTSR
jgi:hypothetical protein